MKGSQALVGYNIQSVVDDEHKLIVHAQATNTGDINALSPLVKTVTEELELSTDGSVEVLADKGYHDARGLHEVEQLGLVPHVAERRPRSKGKRTTEQYAPEEFSYNVERDVYTCPAGKELKTTGNWHCRTGSDKRFKNYRLPKAECQNCPLYGECVGEKVRQRGRGRVLQRIEYAEAVERNGERLREHPEVYAQRQALVEHPFGTLKRSWGGYYTLVRGLAKVDGEYALLACCYNLRRSVSILGVERLLELLRAGKNGENDRFNDRNRAIEVPAALYQRILASRSSRAGRRRKMAGGYHRFCTASRWATDRH